MARVTVVVGGQFGSEGKGAIAGYLGRSMGPRDVAIRVAGPNAGHTAYDPAGREWKLRALPVAAVTSRDCQLHIAAGSEIDLEVLNSELYELDQAGHQASNRLSIHPSATILTPDFIREEQASGIIGRVGSTGKGIGAARAARIRRTASTFGEYAAIAAAANPTDGPRVRKLMSEPGPFDLDGLGHVVVEGTQGYGLGLHTEFYPQVTSSDCRAVDFLAMAGISPWAPQVHELKVIVVARVYPIRVAGNSGPLEGETTWAQLGLPEERTTVTNNVRRVGSWDQRLINDAIRANGGGDWSPYVEVALTMLDQIHPEMRDETELLPASLKFVEELEQSLETHIAYVGTGPNTVVEL